MGRGPGSAFAYALAAAAALLAAGPGAAGAGDTTIPAPRYSVTVKPKQQSRGTVMAIHGGAWIESDLKVDEAAAQLHHVTRWDWTVTSVGYRGGTDSLEDVVAWFDKLRAERGRPICAWGPSAGGHLALLLAVRRHLDCVIAEGPPSYLPETTEPWDLPDWMDPYLVDVFGPDLLDWYSPLLWHDRISAPVVLGHARDDPVVPIAQSREFNRRDDRTRLIGMDAGDWPFTHAAVEGEDFLVFRDAAKRVLRASE